MRKIISGIMALFIIGGLFIYNAASGENVIICAEAAAQGIAANPLISRNAPAYSEKAQNNSYGNDEGYWSFWTSEAPDYLAYDLSGVPAGQRNKVIAVWYNVSTYDNIGQYVSRQSIPIDYTIEINDAEGGTFPESGWKTVKEVTGNEFSSRQCLVDMEGCNWIRIRVTKSMGDSISFNFDIHDASEGVSDSWIFFGDSITAGGMPNCYGTNYATYVNQLDSRYYPIQENGGIGGISSYHGRDAIDSWLADTCVKYVSIAYGTNDSWGNQSGTDRYYESTKYMIDAVLEAGKVPVLPAIPYSTNPDVNSYLDNYNAEVKKLYEEYGDKLVHGPDFDSFFRENPDLLSGDGVHPSFEGYEAMRKYWAEVMYETVYTAEQPDITDPPSDTPSEPPSEPVKGDVNDDGSFDVADLVMLQKWIVASGSLANPENGDMNADDSIDVADVTAMRRKLLIM